MAEKVVQQKPEMEYDVFISHCLDDEEIANNLKNFLQSQEMSCEAGTRKLKVWTFNECVPYGHDYVVSFTKAIQNSRRFVMICTPEFFASDYCLQEYTMANWHQKEKGIVTCIPVLCKGMLPKELPTYMRHINCIKHSEPEFNKKILRIITDDVKLTSVIEVSRTGVGLAWSYFYGYLNIILPDILHRIKEKQEAEEQIPELKNSPIYPKFITIVPLSCQTPKQISDLDPNFQFAFHLKKEQNVAGNKDRDYSNSVYKFTYKNEKTQQEQSRHLVIEFATPVRSLRLMHEGGLAHLDELEMRLERDKFIDVVKQILEFRETAECRGKCLVVDFRDVDFKSTSSVEKKQSLTEAVLAAIEEDEKISQIPRAAASQ